MRVLLNVDATQCIAYSPEAKVARPNSATLGPPRVYEPKVMAKPTLSHTHLRIRLSPSPLVPRPSPFDPRCQTSKKLPSPPRVYVYEQKAHAISHRNANVRASWSTFKHEFVPSSRVSWSTRSMRRDELDLLTSFETTHQVRAAIEQERWRTMSLAQRGESAPRVYEPTPLEHAPPVTLWSPLTYQALPGRPWALDRRQPQASEPVLFQELLETLLALHPTAHLCNRPCSPLVSLVSLRNGCGCWALGSTGLRAAHCLHHSRTERLAVEF